MKKPSISISISKPVQPRPLLPHIIFFFKLAIKSHSGIFEFLFTSGEVDCNSNHCSCFCRWTIFTPTCPNSDLFQASSFDLHSSRHRTIGKLEVEDRPLLHDSETTCSHLTSPNHIDSKQNSFFFFPCFGLFRKCKRSGL
ncbi:hypothetical protein ACB094_06G080400 [Castanea mollissima]